MKSGPDLQFFPAAFRFPGRILTGIKKTPLKNPARIPGKKSAKTIRNSLTL